MSTPSFENKVVLVTGGTSGIGRESAIQFARLGAHVVLTGRREAEGSAVISEITDAGGTALFVKGDISIEADVKNMVETTVSAYGRLDIAFNNAGVEMLGPIIESDEAAYRKVFDINVWGVVASMKYEIPVMQAQGGGVIINTSSVAGHVGMPGAGLYVATKHAVEGLTKCAALEVAALGIRVNAVAPAAIETDMLDRFAGTAGSEMRSGLAAMHPIGRMGRSEEVVAAVLFLASDAASFITGHSLAVDGGWMAK